MSISNVITDYLHLLMTMQASLRVNTALPTDAKSGFNSPKVLPLLDNIESVSVPNKFLNSGGLRAVSADRSTIRSMSSSSGSDSVSSVIIRSASSVRNRVFFKDATPKARPRETKQQFQEPRVYEQDGDEDNATVASSAPRDLQSIQIPESDGKVSSDDAASQHSDMSDFIGRYLDTRMAYSLDEFNSQMES